MKLMSPVNSYESVLAQIESGADEIYLGLDDGTFERISFSARARVLSNGRRANVKEGEFKKIVDAAHSSGVSVNYTANLHFSFKTEDNWFQNAYYEYIQKGIELGVDALIVSDMANILFLNQKGVSTPIVAGSYFNIFNSETVGLFKELNVKRVVLPDQVTLDEIKKIKDSTDLEIEVFVGFGCSNIPGNCSLEHNVGEDIYLGVPCKSAFYCNNSKESICMLDSSLDCALCSLVELYNAGVDSVKLVGREQDHILLSKITRMYSECINEVASTGALSKERIKKAVGIVEWWENNMCNDSRCKYKTSKIMKSYI